MIEINKKYNYLPVDKYIIGMIKFKGKSYLEAQTMNHTKIYVVKNPDEMGVKAADLFEAVIKGKPACVIGLATGSTPLPLYREMIAREKAGKIDFSNVRSANLDEYKGLAPDHPQSYRKFMQDNLFDHISIKRENTIVPDGLAADIPAMCAAYEDQIEK